jgi:PhnB protein
MKLMPQLAFNGLCQQAFETYRDILRGEITTLHTFDDARDLPPGSTASAPGKVRFAELRVGAFSLLGNDVPADEFEPMRGFNVALHLQSVAEAERVFGALAEGGEVSTPLTRVAWAPRFGMVTDRFETPWLILALEE